MPISDQERKAIQKYRKTHMELRVNVTYEEADAIKAHAKKKGFDKVGAYIKNLIIKDMSG